MQLLLTLITTVLAATLVVFAPGASLLALMRLDRVVPPPLVPAAALSLGLVPLGATTGAALLLHQPIEAVVLALGAFVIACWIALARRDRRERQPTARGARTPSGLAAVVRPVRNFVAGEWLRGTPNGALALAIVGGVLALTVGFYAWNDSLYHIGQAQKLLALDAPTFSNTLQFRDGSAHPGYLLPAWHEAIALTAYLARVDAVVAGWILPGLAFPTSLLAFGGLGWSLTRARGASTVFAAALLVLTIGTLPLADTIVNGLHPGAIALGVLVPLVLAMLFTAVWPETSAEPDGVTPRTITRAATFVAIVAVAGIGMLHVSYLWVLGMGILGYYLLWALHAPWPRAVVMRHLTTGAAIALVAATCIALLLPGLNRLEGLGRDAKAELEYNDSAQYEGENAANLDALLRGDPAGAFHLRSDYLVLAGGLALLGLLGVPLVLLAPRWPGGWYLAGSTFLVLAIATSDTLFPGFVKLVTLDQARRIERVLPLVAGLGVLALAIGASSAHLLQRGGRARIWGIASVAAGIGAVALATDRIAPLAGYGGERIVHPRVLLAVLLVLAAGIALEGVALGLRLWHRRRDTAAEHASEPARSRRAEWTWPTEMLGRAATSIAVLVLLVGAAPAYARIGDVVDDGRLRDVPLEMRTAEMRLFAANVGRELRELPTGSTVLADPRSRNGYIAMAIAPVYVVSSVPRHTALTPENRVEERFDRAVSFFTAEADGGLSRDERIQLLLDERVDAVITHPFGSAEAQKHLQSMPGVRVAVIGTNQKLYVIDRRKLAARR